MKFELDNDAAWGLMIVALVVALGAGGVAVAVLALVVWAFFAWAVPAIGREYRDTRKRCEASRAASRARIAREKAFKPFDPRRYGATPVAKWVIPSEKPWPILFDSLQEQSRVATHNK